MKFTIEYMDQEGAIHETTINAHDEEDAVDIFVERYPGRIATIAYPKDQNYDC
jgi:hypothetical protein